jgi:pimeloyl-ACP methyl ester carboxylesterase
MRRDAGRKPDARYRVAAISVVFLAAGLLAGVAWLSRDRNENMPASDLPAFFKTEEAEGRYMAAYDMVLRKWPVDYEDVYVPTSLGLTHVIASGPRDAPPLILLHAALATAVVWRPNVEALSQHFRVYAVDIVGQGGKTVASRKIKTRRDFADWMNEVFDGLGVESASIVGNSYGGFLALNQASLAPERVDRVVLISPAGGFVSVVPLFRSMIFRTLEGQVLRFFGAPRPRPDITLILGGKGHFNPDDEDWLALGGQLMGGSLRVNMIMPAVISEAEFRTIRTPTLLLIAEHEILYEPHATLRRAMERMPGLEGDIVADAHHLAAMAQPDAVNARIIAFLQQR